jgi:3-hydroxybutyryl-CoA dehydrogenase
MVAQNTFGRKSRRGFYEYDSQGNPLDNPRQPSSEENCPGEGKQITLSHGSFAPGLQELLHACRWHVTPISEGLRNTFAAVISANKDEGALDLVYELDLALPPGTPVLLQSADLTLAEAAGGMSHPERLVGFDGLFLTGRLVTLAALPQTNPSAVAAASEVFHSLGKETCLVDDSPALVLPRIVCTLVNEAAFALGESVADAGTIDTAMKLGTNFPFGPLEWGRKLGYPTVAIILDHLRREYGEERYRLAPLLRRWSRLPPP